MRGGGEGKFLRTGLREKVALSRMHVGICIHLVPVRFFAAIQVVLLLPISCFGPVR